MIPNQKTPKLEASTSIDMEQLEPLGSSFIACDHPRARNRSSNHCHKALRVPQVCQWGMGTRNPMIYHHVSPSIWQFGHIFPKCLSIFGDTHSTNWYQLTTRQVRTSFLLHQTIPAIPTSTILAIPSAQAPPWSDNSAGTPSSVLEPGSMDTHGIPWLMTKRG